MEEVKLPKEVEIDAKELDFDDRDEDEVIGDYLSDKYGFCHFGFKFEKDGDKIQVSDIEWDTSESLKEDKEEDAEDVDVEAEVEVEEHKEDAKEPKLETFEDKIDFLIGDEDEAIAGYDKIIAMLGDGDVNANAIEQLTHLKEEEVAHKDFLEVLKKDPSAIYNHEDKEEEPIENDDDKIEVSNDEFIDDIALDDIDDAFGEGLDEDTVKQNGKWVNKGKEGTHGKFDTKKEADAQRKAMFANGYQEDFDDDFGFNHVLDESDDEELGTVNWDDLDDEEDDKLFIKTIKAVDDDILDKHFGKDTPERKLVGAIKDIKEDSHNTGHIKAKKPIELKARVEK